MTIDASDGQGTQIGSGNTQYNNFGPKAPLDPVALSALSPHVAIARLRSRSHDELVDFFAVAPLDLVGEILAAFLAADEATVVAILADINRRKATELIGALAGTEPWLAQLPEAAEAIAAKAAALKWVPAKGLQRVTASRRDPREESLHGLEGYAREYWGGRIYWSRGYGARPVSGAIVQYSVARQGRLGLPCGDQEPALSSPSGTRGVRQSFRDGRVYSSERGTYEVPRTWLEEYENEGDSRGWLGFPITEPGEVSGLYWVQAFEGGAIYAVAGSGTFAARSAVLEAMPDSSILYPASKEKATRSSLGTPGRVQQFVVDLIGGGRVTAVYSSDRAGIVPLWPLIRNYYDELGGSSSWLGFPAKPARDQGGVGYQSFEAGIVYWQEKTGPLAVRREVDTLRWQEKLGYPVTEEQSFGVDGTDRIQFFDWGVVTRRNGSYEVWHRPKP